MNCHDCLIRRLTLYKSASPSDIEKLFQAKKAEHHLKKGNLIPDGPRLSPYVMVLHTGMAFAFALLSDGRRQILSFFYPGDIITPPLLSGRSIHAGVRALTDITVCEFDRKDFFNILEGSHDLIQGAFDYFEEQRRIAEEVQVGLGMLSAEEAVARMILNFAQRSQKDGAPGNRINFPLRLGHIAEAVGITEIHAGRIMRGLEKRGLIKRETSDSLTINLEGLQQLVPCLN